MALRHLAGPVGASKTFRVLFNDSADQSSTANARVGTWYVSTQRSRVVASTSAALAPPESKPSRRDPPPPPQLSPKARRRPRSASTPPACPAHLPVPVWLDHPVRFRRHMRLARTRLRLLLRHSRLTLLPSVPVDRRRSSSSRIARARNVPARAPLVGRHGTTPLPPPDVRCSSSRRGAR